MRVILLLTSLGTGGAEFSSLQLYGWLSRKGYNVKLVILKEANPSYDPGHFGLHEVVKLKSRNPFSRAKELIRIIKGFKTNVVHSVLSEANLVGRLARLYNSSFVHLESLVNEMYSEHRYHDPNVTRTKLLGYRLLDWLTQLWGVDHYHANGVSVANHYQMKLGINEKRITIVPRGRDANPFLGDEINKQKVREEFLVNDDRVLIVNVGRQEFQKGQDVLLEAIASLKEEDRNKLKVIILGREGNLSSTLQRMISEYQLEDYVELTGYRSDVSAILAAADIFVFPSRFEGLPGSLIEAEAAGLPIVCTDIPNNKEVVSEKNALLSAVDDARKLSFQIMDLVENDNLRKEFGRHSHEIFIKDFDVQIIFERMENLLKKLSANFE